MNIIQRSGDRLTLDISGKKSLQVLLSLVSGTVGLLILLTVNFFEDNPVLTSVFIAFANQTKKTLTRPGAHALTRTQDLTAEKSSYRGAGSAEVWYQAR